MRKGQGGTRGLSPGEHIPALPPESPVREEGWVCPSPGRPVQGALALHWLPGL